MNKLAAIMTTGALALACHTAAAATFYVAPQGRDTNPGTEESPFKTVQQAQRKMTGVKTTVYRPRKAAAAVYAELYGLYRQLHDAFGTAGYAKSLDRTMKDLIAIRNRVRKG